MGDPFLSECHLKKRLHYFFSILLAIPLKTEGVSFRAMEYSPLLGGFAVVLADGRGGFLSADTASFECSVSMICSDSTWLVILDFLCASINWSHCIHLCRCYYILSTNALSMQSYWYAKFCIYHKQEVFVSSNLSIFTVGLFQVMLHPKFDDKIFG